MYDDESTASFLDKTDWRKTIHRELEMCINAKGTFYYRKHIDSLIDSVAAEYPNFDAKQQILKQLDELEKKYDYAWELWLKLNPTKRRNQKYIKKLQLQESLCHDMFEFIKNLCAKKRMLLWGHKKISGGKQIEYNE